VWVWPGHHRRTIVIERSSNPEHTFSSRYSLLETFTLVCSIVCWLGHYPRSPENQLVVAERVGFEPMAWPQPMSTDKKTEEICNSSVFIPKLLKSIRNCLEINRFNQIRPYLILAFDRFFHEFWLVVAQASVLNDAEIRRAFRIIQTSRHASRNRLAFTLSLYAGLRVRSAGRSSSLLVKPRAPKVGLSFSPAEFVLS
jgi:hypothetical protein